MPGKKKKAKRKAKRNSAIEEYLRMMVQMRKTAKHTNSIEEIILRHGKPMVAVDDDAVIRGEMKMCFMNSQRLMLEEPELRYCEGYALNIIPVLHAWCIDKHDNVIDPTWKNPTKVQYHGIIFKNEYLFKRQLETEHYLSLLDDYHGGWPLMTSFTALKEALWVPGGDE